MTTGEGPEVPDAQVEAALLFLVIELDPEHLTLGELIDEMGRAADSGLAREADAIRRAATRLQEAGLLCQRGGRIVPTTAALRFNSLYI